MNLNLFVYNPKASPKSLFVIMGLWTGLWLAIAAVQREPLDRSDWMGIAAAIFVFNALVGYLWFLRNWQKLIVDSAQNIISCDKRFLIPKTYKTHVNDVKRIEFEITAIDVNATSVSKKETVEKFRNFVTKGIKESFQQADDILDAMKKAHLELKEPFQGVVAVTGVRLKNEPGKTLLFAEIDDKKALEKFLKFFKSKKVSLSYRVRWR